MAKNGKVQDYAYLDQLSTEELEELLRADSPESSHDDVILHILEVIEEREKEHPTGRLPDVDKSWEDFQKYYNTSEGEGLSLYPSECHNDLKTAPRNNFKATHKHHHLRRIMVSAAAMIVLAVFMIPPALGYGNIIEMIAHWTTEQFHFSDTSESPVSQTGNNQTEGEYASLQDALEQYGIYDAVVPQYIPDGFKLQEIWVQEYPDMGKIEFSAPYENDDDNIVITIIQNNGQANKSYEKNGQAVEKYMSGNIEHYIFQNNNNTTAAWYVGSLECSISTTLPVTELEKMIDSIY